MKATNRRVSKELLKQGDGGADEGHAAQRQVAQISAHWCHFFQGLQKRLMLELKYAAGFAECKCQQEKREKQDSMLSAREGLKESGNKSLFAWMVLNFTC